MHSNVNMMVVTAMPARTPPWGRGENVPKNSAQNCAVEEGKYPKKFSGGESAKPVQGGESAKNC